MNKGQEERWANAQSRKYEGSNKICFFKGKEDVHSSQELVKILGSVQETDDVQAYRFMKAEKAFEKITEKGALT